MVVGWLVVIDLFTGVMDGCEKSAVDEARRCGGATTILYQCDNSRAGATRFGFAIGAGDPNGRRTYTVGNGKIATVLNEAATV